MSEVIKHECGIALLRLLKPLEYYAVRYGTAFYALNKMQLLMEKQHNRGQDGAGLACVSFDPEPGMKYIHRVRSNAEAPIIDVFGMVMKEIETASAGHPDRLHDVQWLKHHTGFGGELFLGHLRYGTFGGNGIKSLHPVLRENNWMTRNLVLAGNFNLTNVDELFQRLISYGQFPVATSDTTTILEKIGHFLDEENERLYARFRQQGHSKREITPLIAGNLDLAGILTQACRTWDGGYVIAGMLGHGDAFVMRDPQGIRPAFFYRNEEALAVASERPVLQTTFNCPIADIHEIEPGHALIIRRSGTVQSTQILPSKQRKSCSFERIYFSRGTDADIYQERKNLGKRLARPILESVGHDLDHTVFSYIPNTAVVAFYGLMEELQNFCSEVKMERIMSAGDKLTPSSLREIMALRPRMEQIAVKDVKMRTFITQDKQRDDLVAHVYDVTYGIVRDGIDSLVVLDDSIVRGTTLKQSIIRILDRLNPKHIIIASSAPQIRYPDCYGIDMAKLHDFVAFNAAIDLLKERDMGHVINDVYKKCKAQEKWPKEEIVNHVKEIYKPFCAKEISERIAQLVTPAGVNAGVSIIFQTIEDLHAACPGHTGDWYFTGDYPTPGGNKVVNQAFINYIEGRNVRAY